MKSTNINELSILTILRLSELLDSDGLDEKKRKLASTGQGIGHALFGSNNNNGSNDAEYTFSDFGGMDLAVGDAMVSLFFLLYRSCNVHVVPYIFCRTIQLINTLHDVRINVLIMCHLHLRHKSEDWQSVHGLRATLHVPFQTLLLQNHAAPFHHPYCL